MVDTPLGPSVWAASDGRAGNAAQVRAVVRALSETQRWMRIAHINAKGHRADPITLTPSAPWTWLPPNLWPSPLRSLPKSERAVFKPPWPTIWISAGRRSAPFAAKVRTWSGGETLVVHILDPRIPPDAFDLVVAPNHDALEGSNVVSTLGAPAYFAPDDIEDAGLAFADLADEPGRKAVVVLGGDSNTHKFSTAAAQTLSERLRALSGQGWRLRITGSRRTPVPVRAQFRQLADDIGAQYWDGPADGPNPYLAWLLFSEAAIVTEDSANMLSDAAYFGLPIHMAKLDGGSPKFDRLHQGFIDRGCARWFDGALEAWSYEPLREADKVADAIVELLIQRRAQPEMPAIADGPRLGDYDRR
ncbi:MAG: mitochondrial fission ELM1 family protein [Pseudomonadota bacterium]